MKSFNLSPTKSESGLSRARSLSRGKFSVSPPRRHDSSFQFLLDNVKESILSLMNKFDESAIINLSTSMRRLNQNYSSETKPKSEILIASGILDLTSSLPTLVYGDVSIITESCTLFYTLLKSYKLFKDSLTAHSSIIVKTLEIFIHGLLTGVNTLKLKCSLQLAIYTIQTYTSFPNLAEAWFELRSSKELKSTFRHEELRKTFPTFNFLQAFLELTMIPESSDTYITQFGDALLKKMIELIDKSEAVRQYFFSSKLDLVLLSYPISLRDQASSNKSERERIEKRVKPEYFNKTQEYKNYRLSLEYYIEVIKKSKNEDTINHLTCTLNEYFGNLLVYYSLSKASIIAAISFEGIKIFVDKMTAELNSKFIQSLLNNPLFHELLWSSTLCFKESDYHISIERFATRITHRYSIDFLSFIFASKSQSILKTVYNTGTVSANQGPKEIMWFLSIVSQCYPEQKNPGDVALRLSYHFGKASNLMNQSSNKILMTQLKPMNYYSIFYQLIVVRLNLFFFFDVEENKEFFGLLKTILLKTYGTLLDNEESPLLFSLKNLFTTSQAVIDHKQKINSLTKEIICQPYDDIKFLLSHKDVQHWIYDQTTSPLKLNFMEESFYSNYEQLKRFVIDSYCLKKSFKILQDWGNMAKDKSRS